MNSQYLAQGWEEIKQMKAELWIYFQDADQQIENMKRRGAELEPNIAQNMVQQVKVRSNFYLNKNIYLAIHFLITLVIISDCCILFF